MRELELKFLLDEGAERSLRTRIKTGALKPLTRKEQTLHSVYYDEPELRLRKNRLSLRLRYDGVGWVQTVKTRRQINTGLSVAQELNTDVPDQSVDLKAIPDKAARKQITKVVNGASLAPVCETVINRTAYELRPDNRSRVELAIDVGEIRAGDRVEQIREAEIELLEGAPRVLFRVAHALFPDGGTRFSRRSKAERGYMLAEQGRSTPPIAPRHAERLKLEPYQTIESATQAILRECLEQVSANITACEASDDPEGPHQLRVGLRRLRVALAIIQDVSPNEEGPRLAEEARWLAAEAGRLRDLQVLRDDAVLPAVARYPAEPGLPALAAELEARIAVALSNLRDTLSDQRIQAMMLDMICFTELRGWLVRIDTDQTEQLAEPFFIFAERILDARWRKLQRKAEGLETLSTEERHAFRKALKKMRYAADFQSAAFPKKRTKAYFERMTTLQDLLGQINDAALARRLLESPDAPGHGDPEMQRAVGLVLGALDTKAETAWSQVGAAWAKLVKRGRFWRML